MNRFVTSLSLALAAAAWTQPVLAQTVDDYADLPLEDLLTTEITSVAKKRQQVGDAAAAVTVIRSEDIRRAGARTLVDLLRTVPGVEVAEMDGASTALSVRGFNTRFANTLLVMIDGRSIYVSPLSGVLWDQQLVPLEDIERIEVVRGPGATLWGSNAVNGVINIITKHSVDTLGAQGSAVIGSESRTATLRYGARLGENTALRLYVTGNDHDSLRDSDGTPYNKGWQGIQGGFRLDAEPNDRDAFTLQGDLQSGSFHYTQQRLVVTPQGAVRQFDDLKGGFDGANLVARWSRRQSDALEWSAQFHYDRVARRDLEFSLSRDQLDLDLGVRWQASERQELVFGLNARAAWDDINGTGSFVRAMRPKNKDQWISGFIQDDIWLLPDALRLSLGTKFEHNSISGSAWQPSVRMLWRPHQAVTFWGAVSKAVRTPARFETSGLLNLGTIPPRIPPNPSPIPLSLVVVGSEAMQAETTWAYEAGARLELGNGWKADIAGYYNDYKKLRSYTPVSLQPFGVPVPQGLRLTYEVANDGHGHAYGFEATIGGPLAAFWDVRASYSFLDLNITEAMTPFGVPVELQNPGLSPRHQASLINRFTLSDRVEADATLRYVSKLTAGPVPSYVDLDLRMGWRVTPTFDLAIEGRNLLEKRRLEFVQPFYPVPPGYVARSVALSAQVRF